MGVSAGMVLGVPVVSAIAGAASLRAAMLFLAAANGVSLLAVLFFLPALPAAERVTYGSQVRVLKRSGVWLSILGVVLLNGSIFGVYSYLSEYLGAVTVLPAQLVSVLLLLYGLANILGNAIGGRGAFPQCAAVCGAVPSCAGRSVSAAPVGRKASCACSGRSAALGNSGRVRGQHQPVLDHCGGAGSARSSPTACFCQPPTWAPR